MDCDYKRLWDADFSEKRFEIEGVCHGVLVMGYHRYDGFGHLDAILSV